VNKARRRPSPVRLETRTHNAAHQRRDTLTCPLHVLVMRRTAMADAFLQSAKACDLAVLWKARFLPFADAGDCPGQARGVENGSDILPLNV
jgi:hypothetical protein